MEKSTSDLEIEQKVATTASVTKGTQNAEIHQWDQKANTLSHGINGNRYRELVISIKEMVGSSFHPPLSSNECCIYRIPVYLRKLNEEAYTPQVISIGPFHHVSKSLEPMKKLKLEYFKRFLQRISSELEILVEAIKLQEEKVRDCYAETIKLTSDDFVKLILVDGCFLIEFFNNLSSGGEKEVIHVNHTLSNAISLMMDILLLENQLPLFVLEILFSLAYAPYDRKHPSFTALAIDVLDNLNIQELPNNLEVDARHFVDLARAFLLPSSRKIVPRDESNLARADHFHMETQLYKALVKFKVSSCKYLHDLTRHLRHLVGLARAFFLPSSKKPVLPHESNDLPSADHLYTASQLHEAGVKFKVSSSKCLLDLKFTNRTLEIPSMNLNNLTEAIYRNIIAFEQCHYPFDSHFTNYIVLLNFLINTTKDVDLLIKKGILINWLGSSEAVTSLVNSLDTNVRYDGTNSDYRRLFRDLNAFYEDPKHTWKATLKRDYFSTPWRIASTAAAVILLLLTLGQFICSIIQVVKM